MELVVKCGGRAGIDTDAVCRDVAQLAAKGMRIVLVHGGSADIDELALRLGVARRGQVAPDGVASRHTDEAMLRVVTMALLGATAPRLVGSLHRHGVPAVGMTGVLRARRKAPQRAVVDGRRMVVRDNHAGTVSTVDTDALRTVLSAGRVPVVPPPAVAENGELLNVNADRAAAAVAAALRADRLILLTGAPGVQRDPDDESSLLRCCPVPRTGPPAAFAADGMALKLIAAREALLGGVPRVRIADGRTDAPVRAALDGAGTEVVVERGAEA